MSNREIEHESSLNANESHTIYWYPHILCVFTWQSIHFHLLTKHFSNNDNASVPGKMTTRLLVRVLNGLQTTSWRHIAKGYNIREQILYRIQLLKPLEPDILARYHNVGELWEFLQCGGRKYN